MSFSFAVREYPRRAGLPDFGGLTQKVVQKLGAEKALAAMERGKTQIAGGRHRHQRKHHVHQHQWRCARAGTRFPTQIRNTPTARPRLRSEFSGQRFREKRAG